MHAEKQKSPNLKVQLRNEQQLNQTYLVNSSEANGENLNVTLETSNLAARFIALKKSKTTNSHKVLKA